MGNTKLRRLLSSEAKWTEQGVKRHQHRFCVLCMVRLFPVKDSHGPVMCYMAKKCEFCNSFVEAKFTKMKTWSGVMLDFDNPHFALGFRDIKLR